MRDVLVLLPLYRQPGLVPDLFRSLISAKDDFRKSGGRLLVIVDSPDDKALLAILQHELPALQAAVPTELLINATNLGFVGSINVGFAKAISENRDVIILNSDVVVTPGAFEEIREVAYLDHMTGFVSPRSNNATICSLPDLAYYRHRPFDESYASFLRLSPFLPRTRYVPTVVGFCMYIKWTILAEFGVFDPVYGSGYNEENDLVMRANRCGYRAVLANHAFVFHIGEQSFSLTSAPTSAREAANGKILRKRFPEYERSINRTFRSPEGMAEVILVGLLPDDAGKLTIAFDWSNIGLYHNGTFEAAKAILLAATKRWNDNYNIVVIASAKTAVFHGIDAVAGVTIVARDKAGIYAAIVRVGQPFEASVSDDLILLSPIVVLYMLDTIAMDCQYLDDVGLQDIWQYSLDSTDVVIYISAYSQTQFRHRFRIPEAAVEIPSLLSLDTRDYRDGDVGSQTGTSILVVGNHFSHKHVDPTVAVLVQNRPDSNIVVLGGSKIRDPLVAVHASGSLDQAFVDQLYQDARVVLFPSHYEGFGLPIIHAIARNRPVIVRSMPLYDEINARLGGSANIYQCETVEEMVRLACNPALRWKEERSFDGNGEGWDRVVADLQGGIETALNRTSFDRLLARYERLDRKQRLSHAGDREPLTPPELNIFGYKIPGLVMIGSAVAAAALLSTLAVLISSAFLAFRGYSALPFWDQWQYVRPDTIVASFLRFHNEHRGIISKLLFLIDAQFAGGRNILLYAAIYMIQALHAIVLVKMAMRSKITGRIRSILVPATTLCALFGAQNYENLTWGFQTQFVMVFALASTSFLSFAIFVDSRRPVYLWGALAAALAGSLEMANGIAILPILILFSLYFRLSQKIILVLFAATAGVGLTYVMGHVVFQANPASAPFDPLLVASYTLVYLGGFLAETVAGGVIGQTLGMSSTATTVRVAFLMGVLLLGLGAWVVWRGLQRMRPEAIAIVCVFLFAAFSAGITAVGRSTFGLESALSGRYVAGSSLATLAVTFLVLWILSRMGRAWVQAAALSAIAFGLIVIALSQSHFIGIADNRRMGRDLATTALYTSVNDEVALRDVFVDTKLVRDQADYLRSMSDSVFADGRYRLLGQKFAGPIADCAVPITSDTPLPSGGSRVTGVADLNPLLLRPPMILVLNLEDRIVGMAFASLQIQQARRVQIKKFNQSVPWIGHVVVGAMGPHRAVLSGKSSGCDQVAASN